MKVQVTIPMGAYKVLEKSCEPKSREYLVLKNGLVREDRRAVTILCEYERGLSFVAWARQKAPDDAHLITINPDI
jgi:hypothetical protein